MSRGLSHLWGEYPPVPQGNPQETLTPLIPLSLRAIKGEGGEKNRGRRGCVAPTSASSSVLGEGEDPAPDSSRGIGMTEAEWGVGWPYGGMRRVGKGSTPSPLIFEGLSTCGPTRGASESYGGMRRCWQEGIHLPRDGFPASESGGNNGLSLGEGMPGVRDVSG